MNQQLPTPEAAAGLFQDTPPLVSVLIRTMGRSTLGDAIGSVRAQRFTDWEIVVLNAGGRPIEGLAQLLAGTRNRVLEPGGRVDRADAANLLLEAAAGPYALFLDDDDWLWPDHLEKLAASLDAQPLLVAAYSDVEALADARTPQQHAVHTYRSEFDPVALQLQNYLPIHAVMFRLERVRSAPASRFDPSMSLFEDWDFWLQLAAKGPFQRVPGVSAVYSFRDEGSGHAARGPHREAMLTAIAQRQLARWHPHDIVRLIERDAQRSNLLNDSLQRAAAGQVESQQLKEWLEASQRRAEDLAHAVTQQSELVAQQQDALTRQEEVLEQRQEQLRLQQQELQLLARVRQELLDQIAEIRSSTSWRLTRPLRYAGRVVRRIRQRLRVLAGLASTFSNQLRRHGPAGLARRLPYYLRHRRAYMSRLAAQPGATASNPFAATAAPPRDMRLHPDLEGVTETVDVKVSIIIPTFNAGPEFQWLLRKLRGQKAVRELEIVVVDSGSRDDTIAFAHAAGATVLAIAQSEFSHSHARNLGADAASGDYLLFMVQDAFPIGEHWLYGMLRFLRDPAHAKLAAVACSEFSRSDSDLMYDSMIDTHYRFLGCLEQDRIGSHQGDDHMSLRSQGQLSDVSCLIDRQLFAQYRYQGDYAEDLDLGIRLIKGGWRVAMLASVKAVHSHNRPAYYYLKRSFVDVEFLVGLFDDFAYPHCESLAGLAAGISSAAVHVSGWLAQIRCAPASELTGARLRESVSRWRDELKTVRAGASLALGDERLEAFIRELSLRYPMPQSPGSAALSEIRAFAATFTGRLEHFAHFAAQVYDDGDELPAHELAAAVCKTLAAAAGSALAFYCLDHRKEGVADREQAQGIHAELMAGV
jgi:glycosyltransferase involved in cell wall biosynthesis